MAAANENGLGRLERVDLRAAWANEAGDFTPWLAQPDNLRLLGEAIGMDLELEAQERNVGPFRADILCKNTATGNRVLIENQLERTDHLHLGQLLTYAAGLKAVSIVWVASQFREEHRATLDWLNEITDDPFNFFGLEIELWRIGDSPAAPDFNVASQPNDWSRSVSDVAKRAELSEAQLLQLEFWTAFRSYVLEKGSALRPTKPQPQNWMNMSVGRSGFFLSAIASMWDSAAKSYDSNEVRAELVLDGKRAKEHFAALETQKVEIEAEVGEALRWYNPGNARVCRIHMRQSTDLQDRNHWSKQHAWLLGQLEILYRVFSPRIRNLPPDEVRTGDDGND